MLRPNRHSRGRAVPPSPAGRLSVFPAGRSRSDRAARFFAAVMIRAARPCYLEANGPERLPAPRPALSRPAGSRRRGVNDQDTPRTAAAGRSGRAAVRVCWSSRTRCRCRCRPTAGMNCRKLFAVKVVTGSPQFGWLNTFTASIRISGRTRPTWNDLKSDRSTFHTFGRRNWLRLLVPKPSTSRPVGCENSDLS